MLPCPFASFGDGVAISQVKTALLYQLPAVRPTTVPAQPLGGGGSNDGQYDDVDDDVVGDDDIDDDGDDDHAEVEEAEVALGAGVATGCSR